MTDGLEAARRSEVAKSFRYARAFYDEAEAAGPAEFERNRQAIIDVIALAYRDGRASARAGESALRAAAQEERVLELVSKYVAIGDYWHARGLKSWPIDATVLDRFARASLSILGGESSDMALRVAAQEVMKSYEAYVALGSDPGTPLAPGSPPKPEDQWDEYDYMMIPAWRRLKSALDGAPWEPSEEQVEQALSGWFSALPNWREQLSLSANAVSDLQSRARAALKAAMGSATST